jgi:hypothetical protein
VQNVDEAIGELAESGAVAETAGAADHCRRGRRGGGAGGEGWPGARPAGPPKAAGRALAPGAAPLCGAALISTTA